MSARSGSSSMSNTSTAIVNHPFHDLIMGDNGLVEPYKVLSLKPDACLR
jgi:hypothetical protein